MTLHTTACGYWIRYVQGEHTYMFHFYPHQIKWVRRLAACYVIDPYFNFDFAACEMVNEQLDLLEAIL